MPSTVDTITVEELETLLTTRHTAAPPLLLVHASAHTHPDPPFLPTAIALTTHQIDVYQDDPTTAHPLRVHGNYNLRPPHELKTLLASIGASRTTRCIIYENPSELERKGHSCDPIVAARVAWALAYCGVERVSLLDGGLGAWVRAKRPLVDAPAPPRARALDIPRFPANPHFLATLRDVQATSAGASREKSLLDVRSIEEYSGEKHDYPYPLPNGRIPGAALFRWGSSTYRGGLLADASTGVLRGAATSVAALPPGEVIFYCGSGWRSSLAWCIARISGVDNVRNYDGGFMEWAYVESSNAIEVGRPERPVCAVASARPCEYDGSRLEACGACMRANRTEPPDHWDVKELRLCM